MNQSEVDCSSVRAHRAELATQAQQQGRRSVTCFDREASNRATANAENRAALAAVTDPALLCVNPDQLDTWVYSRNWFCRVEVNHDVTVIDLNTGAPIGGASYTIGKASSIDP